MPVTVIVPLLIRFSVPPVAVPTIFAKFIVPELVKVELVEEFNVMVFIPKLIVPVFE